MGDPVVVELIDLLPHGEDGNLSIRARLPVAACLSSAAS